MLGDLGVSPGIKACCCDFQSNVLQATILSGNISFCDLFLKSVYMEKAGSVMPTPPVGHVMLVETELASDSLQGRMATAPAPSVP